MCCESCRVNFDTDGILPECSTGSCPTCFDQLDNDDFRILEAHWVASHLAEMGLSQMAAEKYNLDHDDLIQIATIESVCRQITKESQGDHSG